MKQWFEHLKQKSQCWMIGRYGQDKLSTMLTYVALVLILITTFIPVGGTDGTGAALVRHLALSLLLQELRETAEGVGDLSANHRKTGQKDRPAKVPLAG